MTKTKKQLRAEAVERLKNSEYHTALDDVCSMLGWGHEPHFEGATDALIDLLADDDANDDSTPEKVVSGSEQFLTPLSNPNETGNGDDSREKLEADIERYLSQAGCHEMVCGWLDRQAAITAEETSNAWEEYSDATQREIAELTAERDELQAQADEKWNLYVAERRRADSNAADREMYREATSALVDSITDGLRKVDAILDGKDEGLA